MKNGLTIGFEYHENFYYSFVEVKETDSYTQYDIRLMDSRMTRLVNDDHVILEKDGYLHVRVPENDSRLPFKTKVAESLSQFLRKPIRNASDPQN